MNDLKVDISKPMTLRRLFIVVSDLARHVANADEIETDIMDLALYIPTDPNKRPSVRTRLAPVAYTESSTETVSSTSDGEVQQLEFDLGDQPGT